MKKLLLVLSVALLLFVGACSGSSKATPTAKPVVSVDAIDTMAHQEISVSPGESLEVTTPTPPIPPSGPIFDTVFIDRVELLKSKNPAQPQVRLVGSLPTACHKLVVKIDPISEGNNILIKMLSTIQLPNKCKDTRLGFDHTVTITGLKPGKYTIWVSQGKIGQVTIPS
jgi:hypothetical protein